MHQHDSRTQNKKQNNKKKQQKKTTTKKQQQKTKQINKTNKQKFQHYITYEVSGQGIVFCYHVVRDSDFVSAQYLENKLMELDHILHMH